MAAWHLEIHAKDGRTVCQWDVEARRVSEIEAVRSNDTVGILLNGETGAVGYPTVAQAKEGGFTLHRWPLGESKDPVVTEIS